MGKKKNRGANKKTATTPSELSSLSSSDSSKAESPTIEQTIVETPPQIDSQSINEEFYDAGDDSFEQFRPDPLTDDDVEEMIQHSRDSRDDNGKLDYKQMIMEMKESLVKEEVQVDEDNEEVRVDEETNKIDDHEIQVEDLQAPLEPSVAVNSLDHPVLEEEQEEPQHLSVVEDEFDDFVEASPSKTSSYVQEEPTRQVSFEDLVQLIAERHGAEIEATIMAAQVPLLPINLDDIRSKAMEMFEECRRKSRPQVKFNFAQSEFYQRILSLQNHSV